MNLQFANFETCVKLQEKKILPDLGKRVFAYTDDADIPLLGWFDSSLTFHTTEKNELFQDAVFCPSLEHLQSLIFEYCEKVNAHLFFTYYQGKYYFDNYPESEDFGTSKISNRNPTQCAAETLIYLRKCKTI